MKDYDSNVIVPLGEKEEPEPGCSDENRRCDDVKRDEKLDEAIKEEREEQGPDFSDWDGSEAEVIADDDAAVYEEEQTGIKIDYSLKKEEIVSCLKHCGVYKTIGKRAAIEIALLAVFSVVFFAYYFSNHQAINLLLGFISIIVMVFVCAVPNININRRARAMSNKGPIYVEIYPDNIVVGKNGMESEISLDGTSRYEEFNNMLLIYPNNGGLLVIPIRSVEPDFIADVQAMLVAGTAPREED